MGRGFAAPRKAQTPSADVRTTALSTPEQALETQMRNLQARAGKNLDELRAILRASGLARHGELRDLLKRELGMGHGDANTFAHFYLKAEAGAAARGTAGSTASDPAEEIYTGSKAHLRPIHDRLLVALAGFGPFEIAPKKGYLSLRRKKQFAMIGPATQTRVEVGLNAKGLSPTARLLELPPGGMCQYKVKLTAVKEVDKELLGWIRQAYDGAA